MVIISVSVLAIDQRHPVFANAYCDPSHFLASRLNGYNPGGLSITITSTLDSTLYMQTVTMQGRLSEMSYMYSPSASASNTRICPSAFAKHDLMQSTALVYSIRTCALRMPIEKQITQPRLIKFGFLYIARQ